MSKKQQKKCIRKQKFLNIDINIIYLLQLYKSKDVLLQKQYVPLNNCVIFSTCKSQSIIV